MKKLLGLFLSLFILINSIPICYAADTTVYIVGASTASEYEDRHRPMYGWGEKLAEYLPKGVKVANKALSGYSTKLFADSGKLAEVLSNIRQGDILLIQFGHNDQAAADATKYTDINTYKEYLKKYIDGARDKKAVPVLLSPIERRAFNSSGQAVPSLTDRAKAMSELAEQENVDFIDINAESLRWWNYLGEEGTKDIFMHLASGESPNYPDGKEDNTHFKEAGAAQIAQLTAHELGKLDLSISKDLASVTSPIPENAVYLTGNKDNNKTDAAKADEEAFSEMNIDGAAGLLCDIGFLQGDEGGNLNEDKTVTRAEFLTILSRIISDYKAVSGSPFDDVSDSHWASDCISYFTEIGFVDGVGGGLFAPDKEVTLSEAVKILLSAMKLTKDDFVYPDDYLLTGARYKLTVGINVPHDKAITRNEASALILNALYVPHSSGEKFISNAFKKIYYVSQNASEGGDGSYEKPWGSPLDALENVQGNAVVIIDGGEYVLNEPLKFSKGGDEKAPFIMRAGYGDKVTIRFVNPVSEGVIVDENADNITISDINFEIENDGTAKLAVCNGDNFSFINNDIKGANIAVELNAAEGGIISNNIISATYGVMLHGCNGTVVSGNTFDYLMDTSVCADGGTANCQIANNTFNVNEKSEAAVIVLGTEDESVYNNVLWQNVIYADGEEIKSTGISCINTTDCYFYNNIISGLAGAVKFSDSNVNPIFRNNIFSECGGQAYLFDGKTQRIDSDYNCFYEAYPVIKETNSKYTNPYFISTGENWNLISFSPCKGNGVAIERELEGYNGEVLTLDWKDAEGKVRGDFWSMGVCIGDSEVEISAEDGVVVEMVKPFLTLDFEKGIGKFINNGGDWTADGGVYAQTSAQAASYRTVYTDGFEWENYEVSADIKSPSDTSGNATGILFRCDEKMQNMYCMRFLANNQVELNKWENNKFASIKIWEYEYTPETYYNFRIVANKNKLSFYVNDELIGEVTDETFKKGSVGCYSYREENEYDNIKIYTIR